MGDEMNDQVKNEWTIVTDEGQTDREMKGKLRQMNVCQREGQTNEGKKQEMPAWDTQKACKKFACGQVAQSPATQQFYFCPTSSLKGKDDANTHTHPHTQ